MTTKRTYKTYPREFKEEAVALVNEQGYSVQKAADSLGIRTNMLYRWKDQLEAEKAGKVLSEDERAELKRLRKEVKDLRMEKEILKKARVDSTHQRNTQYSLTDFGDLCNGTIRASRIKRQRERRSMETLA